MAVLLLFGHGSVYADEYGPEFGEDPNGLDWESPAEEGAFNWGDSDDESFAYGQEEYPGYPEDAELDEDFYIAASETPDDNWQELYNNSLSAEELLQEDGWLPQSGPLYQQLEADGSFDMEQIARAAIASGERVLRTDGATKAHIEMYRQLIEEKGKPLDQVLAVQDAVKAGALPPMLWGSSSNPEYYQADLRGRDLSLMTSDEKMQLYFSQHARDIGMNFERAKMNLDSGEEITVVYRLDHLEDPTAPGRGHYSSRDLDTAIIDVPYAAAYSQETEAMLGEIKGRYFDPAGRPFNRFGLRDMDDEQLVQAHIRDAMYHEIDGHFGVKAKLEEWEEESVPEELQDYLKIKGLKQKEQIKVVGEASALTMEWGEAETGAANFARDFLTWRNWKDEASVPPGVDQSHLMAFEALIPQAMEEAGYFEYAREQAVDTFVRDLTEADGKAPNQDEIARIREELGKDAQRFLGSEFAADQFAFIDAYSEKIKQVTLAQHERHIGPVPESILPDLPDTRQYNK